jgi:hypothetical protein
MNGHMAHLPYRDAAVWFRELAGKEVNTEMRLHFERVSNLIVPGSTIYDNQVATYETTVRELLGAAPDVHAKLTACIQIATLVSIGVSI